jgi:hypothetical protein
MARVTRTSAMTGKNRIMIYGPKEDGTYVVELRTADGGARTLFAAGDGSRVQNARSLT